MPILKCVGGPHDGRRFEVEDVRPYIRIPDPLGPLAAHFPCDEPPTATEYRSTVYTVRKLCGPDHWELRFLAPADWTDPQAIEHQFTK